MDYTIDYEINGEILIPLENNLEKSDSSFTSKVINLEEIVEKNYKDFRSILFQGELLRFFVVLKLDTNSHLNDLINALYFKFEFDPTFDITQDISHEKDLNDTTVIMPEDAEKNIVKI